MQWRTVVVAIVVGVSAAAASAQPPSPRRAAADGRRLALTKCDVCHVVAADQQYKPLLSNYAPSFYDVANRPNTDARSLEAYLAHPHTYGGMPYPDLTPMEVTDLVAYILSLRGQH